MKVEIKKIENHFKPIAINITIETKEELYAIHNFSSEKQSIVNLMLFENKHIIWNLIEKMHLTNL